jgi:hypothetical protein
VARFKFGPISIGKDDPAGTQAGPSPGAPGKPDNIPGNGPNAPEPDDPRNSMDEGPEDTNSLEEEPIDDGAATSLPDPFDMTAGAESPAKQQQTMQMMSNVSKMSDDAQGSNAVAAGRVFTEGGASESLATAPDSARDGHEDEMEVFGIGFSMDDSDESSALTDLGSAANSTSSSVERHPLVEHSDEHPGSHDDDELGACRFNWSARE